MYNIIRFNLFAVRYIEVDFAGISPAGTQNSVRCPLFRGVRCSEVYIIGISIRKHLDMNLLSVVCRCTLFRGLYNRDFH